MSQNDKKKELMEENCLKQACILAKNKKAKTRNIMKMLEGDPVPRTKNDSPDIIVKCNIDNGTVFIGVEHFLVDQATIIKGGKTKSVAQEHRHHILKNYEEGHGLLKKNETIPSELIKKLAANTFQYAAAMNHSGYEELLSAFRISLYKHLSRALEYRKEIRHYSGVSPIKLAFLIEIQCFAKNLFLNHGHSIRNNPDALIPVYAEIVDILENIDPAIVDYVILYIQNAADKNIANVIALETGNIARGLRSQGILIYEYCNDAVNLEYISSPPAQNEKGSYSIYYEVVPDYYDNYMKRFIPGLKKAYTLRKQGKPFAAPRSIHGLMYALGNEVSFITDEDGEMSIKTSLSQEEVIRRYDDFMIKYSIGENERESVG